MIALPIVAILAAPATVPAVPTPVTVDNAAPALEDKDDENYELDLGITNLTDSDLNLSAAPADPKDTDCALTIDKETVPAAQHGSPKLTVPKACDLHDDRIVLKLDATPASGVPITLGITASKPEEPDQPNWDALIAFIATFLGALVLGSAFFSGWPWLYYYRHTTKKARKTPGGLTPEGSPELRISQELPGLTDTYNFKESWVSNITAIAALFTGIFASSDVITAFLGEDGKPSLALATVGAAIAAAFTAAGPIFLLSTRKAKNNRFTVGGLMGAALLTLAGAAGGLYVGYVAVGKLDLGGIEGWPRTAALVLTASLLFLYSFRTLIATLEQGLKPVTARKKKAEVAKKEERAQAATAPGERERAERELQSARAELKAITDLGPAGRTSAMI
jgi:hypothetical protein